MRHNESGFTIVELLLAIAIAGVLSTVLLAISLTFYGNVIQNNMAAALTVEGHYAARAIIEDVRLADTIVPANTLTDANAPADGWTTSSDGNTLIIGSPATTATNDIIYDTDTGDSYRNELVYYIDGTNLRKRTIRNTAATDNDAVTSCPVDAATSGCPADKTYATNVSDVSFTFYDTNNVETADPTLARSVRISITMSRRAFGKQINYTNTIQTALRN